MAFSMFQASVPVCTQILGAMSAIIDKAAAHCAEKKYDEAWLLTDRLYPDMFPLARQFRQCSDFGRNIPGRLAGGELPSFAGDRRHVVRRRSRRGSRSRSTTSRDSRRRRSTGPRTRTSTGRRASGRCHSRAAPTCCISVCRTSISTATTAYNILRHRGVELGKRDFLGSF